MAELSEYQMWTAVAVGQMLVQAQELGSSSVAIRENVRATLKGCADVAFEGNMYALAESVGCKRLLFKSWAEDGAVFGRLDQFLQVWHDLQLPISSLFSVEPAAFGTNMSESTNLVRQERGVGPKRTSERLREILQRALEEDEPRSIAEIAADLGYASTGPLYAAQSELCAQITARYRELGRGYRWKKKGAGTLCDKSEIQQILEENLSKDLPRPIALISAELGYANSSYINTRFPALCKAISTKRSEYTSSLTARIELEMERALVTTPPPMLIEVARGLGFRTCQPLRRSAPRLCDELIAARRAHAAETHALLRLQIEKFLELDPPQAVSEICRQLGISVETMKLACPGLRRKLGEKQREYARKLSEQRRELVYSEVRGVVSQLLLQDEYPTKERVLRLLKSRIPREWKLIYASVKRAREELAAPESKSLFFAAGTGAE